LKYKSDALDELLEGSLFKKKTKGLDLEEDLVDQALHAKIDSKVFNNDDK
jgi:hypothetical protein